MLLRPLFLVTLCLAACSSSSVNVPMDGGAEASAAATGEARVLADTLELAHDRYYACHGLPREEGVWEGSDRECFISLMATHLERQDALSACVRAAADVASQCGQSTPCSSPVCDNAILLDDNPVEEFIRDNCGAASDGESRAELIACR